MVGLITKKIALNALYFSGLPAIGSRWTRGLGSIWMLHHVRSEKFKSFAPNAHLSVSPAFLESQISRLSDLGTEFVTLDEAVGRLSSYRNQIEGKPFISVTLDDGYRDNFENAVPIFRKYNIPYTIYIAPGLVDGNASLWWEDLEHIIESRDVIYVDLDEGRREFDTSTPGAKIDACIALVQYLTTKVDEARQNQIIRDLAAVSGIDVKQHCRDQLMNWGEIIELSKDPLCTIGAHTINHAWLSRLSEDEVRYEIQESVNVLNAEIGYRPAHFAYPYGMAAAAGKREIDIARQLGFTSAVTTRHGVIYPGHNEHLHALPRISINGNFQAKRYMSTLMSGVPSLLNNWGRQLNVN